MRGGAGDREKRGTKETEMGRETDRGERWRMERPRSMIHQRGQKNTVENVRCDGREAHDLQKL